MGMKEMEEHMSALHKQNFDLKLELFHRREKQTGLEERLVAAEQQLVEQSEMREINDQLLLELEKRDQAVEEAVNIICGLEEKVERLARERVIVGRFDSNMAYEDEDSPGSEGGRGYVGSSPPFVTNDSTQPTSRKKLSRMPSFLSEQSEGAEALRSLYLPILDPSLPRLSEVDNIESDGMNSPRLSVLSESSFLSVYGGRNMLEPGPVDSSHSSRQLKSEMRKRDRQVSGVSSNISSRDLSGESSQSRGDLPNMGKVRRDRAASHVDKWVGENSNGSTQHKSSHHGRRFSNARHVTHLSISDVLESPLQRLEKLERSLQRHNASANADAHRASTDQQAIVPRKSDRSDLRQSFNSNSHNRLPPTPDTISTSTLQNYQHSAENMRDISKAQQAFRGANVHFHPSRGVSDGRPRSAGEAFTIQPNGQAWNAETQGRYTDAIDDPRVNAEDPWLDQASIRTRSPPGPDMFNFAARDEFWPRDMMFNRGSFD